ncbi:MAG: ACP S-malonyltransferase [Clostridia bacterium]|nr:ACP S-malonyltransferase [Clostridia bacterium]
MNKIALLFPGQGSQYVGMGKALDENFSIARQTFEEANDILQFDLQKLCFEGDIEELTKTENTQPALLAASVAAFRVYMKEYDLKPSFMAGHSLGEFSALTCAGAIEFKDALRIVRQRGIFMQQAVALGTGSMAAVSSLDKSVIEYECRKFSEDGQVVVVSNYNSPAQTVISGHKNAVQTVSDKLAALGGRVIPLKVSAPFHSPLMKPAAEKLAVEMNKYKFNEPLCPVISNVSALPYEGSGQIVESLAAQITAPVRWQESVEYIQNQGVDIAIEMGPQTVLKNLVKKIAPSIKIFSFDKEEDKKALKDEINLEQIVAKESKGFRHTIVTKSIAIAICTRNRNWDNDEYQKGVVEPYRNIQKMQEKLEEDGKEPSIEQMTQAIEMLRSVFITKKVSVEEQIQRFNELFDVTGTRGIFKDFEMPKAEN